MGVEWEKLKVGLNVRFRPKAEVRELHTFDATPILRMTAFAYKLSFRAKQIADSDRQKSAMSGRSDKPFHPLKY